MAQSFFSPRTLPTGSGESAFTTLRLTDEEKEMDSLTDALLDPRVLVTFIICAFLGAVAVWATLAINNRKHKRALTDQRHQQESAVSRILDSVAKSKDEIIADYEAQLGERGRRVAFLEKESKRLKDRVAQGGLLGMFGGSQRQVVSSLLLENEQLHELLAQKQEQLRDTVEDLSVKLVNRLDEQVRESTNAIRYKQVLLSAFLQQDEARHLLDRLIAEGRLAPAEAQRLSSSTDSDEEPQLLKDAEPESAEEPVADAEA